MNFSMMHRLLIGREQKRINQAMAIFSYERQLIISSSCSLHHTDPHAISPNSTASGPHASRMSVKKALWSVNGAVNTQSKTTR